MVAFDTHAPHDSIIRLSIPGINTYAHTSAEFEQVTHGRKREHVHTIETKLLRLRDVIAEGDEGLS